MKAMGRLWHSSDEQSIRRVRFSKWNLAFLFAACIIMNNLRFTALGDSFQLYGSVTTETLGYAAGILVFAFLPSARILDAGRIGAPLALAAFTMAWLAPGSMTLPGYALGSLAGGLCTGCAFYVFFSYLNNTERFLNLVIIQLFFAFRGYGAWGNEEAGAFLPFAAFLLIAFFVFSIFAIRKNNMPQKPAPVKGSCRPENGCCPIGKSNMGVLFYVYIVYMAVKAVDAYVVNKGDYIDIPVYGAGALLSILAVIIIMLFLGRDALYTLKLFLIVSLAAAALLALDGVFDAKAGSLLYGFANSLGYIAVLYLMGGAARLTVCLKFFRIFCIAECLVSVALNPVVDFLFAGNEEKNNLVALGLMAVICCVMLSRYAVIYKRLFESDWMKELDIMKPKKAAAKGEEAAAPDRTEGLGLTPREKQIFSLMLTEMSVKQIMIELEISKGTFNFHTTNLYRKLGIQSRTELFAKYGRP